MPDDQDPAGLFAQRIVAQPTPTPPPPMPSVVPPPAAGQVSTQSVPSAGPPKGWQVDPDELSAFTHAVESVRDRLRDVQLKVERMRTDRFTPKLGTSPVGTQLEEKFGDRLDAPLDDQKNPTTGGLRPMLACAMRRMDDFVAGAEAAVRAYREHDDSSLRHVNPPNG